jgi:protein-L-isoaspartate O-methyltransferase
MALIDGSSHAASCLARMRGYRPLDAVHRAFGDTRPTASFDLPLAEGMPRCLDWLDASERHGEVLTERLLPEIRRPVRLDEIPFVAERQDRHGWGPAELAEAVRRLGPWSSAFAFAHGVRTGPQGATGEASNEGSSYEEVSYGEAALLAYQRYRSALIPATVCELLGPDLGTAQILDLGCHCGLVALDLAHRGAQHVHGLDLHRHNLAQARFLSDYYRIGNVTFEEGDVAQLAVAEHAGYDVVLCLGLLSHVVDPVGLLDLCRRSATRFVVVDTICHPEPISAYHVARRDPAADPWQCGRHAIELQPTYRAVIDTMRETGFAELVEVVGECETEVMLYADRSRRCLIGFPGDSGPPLV